MNKIITPKFRGSYCNLMRPRAVGDGPEKYSMTIVLPKNEKSTKDFVAALKSEMKSAMTEKFGKAIDFKACKHFPVSDGDEKDQEEFQDCWLINCSNTRQPGILVADNGAKRPVEDADEIYSGAYYHASISVYAWAGQYGKGVSVSLNGVLKVGDGDRFGGSGFDSSDFDDIDLPDGDSSSDGDDGDDW